MAKWCIFKRLKLKIADIAIAINAEHKRGILVPKRQNPIDNFISGEPADCVLDVCNSRLKDFPPFLIKDLLFNTEVTWSLYRREDRNFLWLDSPSPKEQVERMAIIDSNFKRVNLYQVPDKRYKDYIVDPFSYPLDQALIINLLSRGRGLLVHACAVNYRGQGLLFVGKSGSGKTTISNLWHANNGASILSDDRIIIRKIGGRFKIYGTPWYGTGKFASPERASLRGIYFLKHSPRNNLKPITHLEAVTRLITSAFPSFWDKKGMEFALSFCSELLQSVPCYGLGFLPDKSVVSFLKKRI
jgi:hypothetical protein